MHSKEQIAALIEAAQAELEQALGHLRRLPALDWGTFRYSTHLLGNYLSITSACVQLLGMSLVGHADAEVHNYLQNLERMTDLMAHLARHLTHAPAAQEVPLIAQ